MKYNNASVRTCLFACPTSMPQCLPIKIIVLPSSLPLYMPQCLPMYMTNLVYRPDSMPASMPACIHTRAGIFKPLWSPGINAKASIPPAYVAWRAGTITLFLLGA
jgi:hypothetical protein